MKKGISFFAMVKNFNNGKVESFDIMPSLYNSIYDENDNISEFFQIYAGNWETVPVNTKERLMEFVKGELRYLFWSKCEYEFIVLDFPYRTKNLNDEEYINKNRPVKVDVYDQLEPNIPLIVDLLWEEIKEYVK